MKLLDASLRPEGNKIKLLLHFEGFNFITIEFEKGMLVGDAYRNMMDGALKIQNLEKHGKDNKAS